MFKSALYKTIVFSTAILCLLSFASAGQFVPQSAKEVTHYTGDESFICSRNSSDEITDVPHSELNKAFRRSQFIVFSQDDCPALHKSYALNEIRGPPASTSQI